MVDLRFRRYPLSALAVAAAFAGCGGSNTPFNSSPAGVAVEHARPSVLHRVLWAFKGSTNDGAHPEASVVNVNGMLYGTTRDGGANGEGTVFSITTSGEETVLHSFGGSGDGENPLAGLLNVDGTLYGTTSGGGADQDGTVFAITASGTETVLYSFKADSADGAHPQAALLDVNGALYGTTYAGGANQDGTVFVITTSGKETVLHSFGGLHDGWYPSASLLNVNGTLYGTTESGGAEGRGTVFAVTTSGKETVLHSFAGLHDGSYPSASLLNVNGTLYGTTKRGGHTKGTVFAITTSGKETVLYRFSSLDDGRSPLANLINVNGVLYGTTWRGGIRNSACCGTVFTVTASGKEMVLYRFYENDGANPSAGLLNIKGTLYGTTTLGGGGRGTVFAITP